MADTILRALPLALCIAIPTLISSSAMAAGEEELVTGISSEIIEVTSSFTGTRIVIFGTIESTGALPDKYKTYDLAIVLRGPSSDSIVRRKARTLGIWINRSARTYQQLPSSYMVVSTSPLDSIAPDSVLRKLQIGVGRLPLIALDDSVDQKGENKEFQTAYGRIKKSEGLFLEQPGKVEFMSRSMFRAAIEIPSNIPIGIHNMTAYLFSDGELLASNSVPLEIKKTGFERFAYEMAHDNPLIYGLAAVVMAIATGWLAGVIFRKN